MGTMEIVLLAAGGIIFILSFLIPSKGDKRQGQAAPVAQEEIRSLVGQEMEAVKGHVEDVVEEAVTYAMEKTERSLERLSNEKIMAINEYSDTVLSEIHRNHEEAMFLYDMLNSKHVNLKNTVSEVNRTVKEAEETVNSFQKLVPEPVSSFQKPIPEPAGSFKRLTPEPVDSFQKLIPEPVAAVPEPTPKAAFVRAAEEQMALALEKPEKAGSRIRIRSNSNDRILALYNRGRDPVAIARELGLGVGEVKLVIGLYEETVPENER